MTQCALSGKELKGNSQESPGKPEEEVKGLSLPLDSATTQLFELRQVTHFSIFSFLMCK